MKMCILDFLMQSADEKTISAPPAEDVTERILKSLTGSDVTAYTGVHCDITAALKDEF